jgi:hypothetical protein
MVIILWKKLFKKCNNVWVFEIKHHANKQMNRWLNMNNEQNLLVREKPSIGLLAFFGPIVWGNENGLEIVGSWG